MVEKKYIRKKYIRKKKLAMWQLTLMKMQVAMKALCVFHRLLRDGNPNFMSEIKTRADIFQLRKFSDNSSPEGKTWRMTFSLVIFQKIQHESLVNKKTAHHQSVFVRKYSQYLEEKVLVYKTLRVEFERNPDQVKTYTIEELLERLPRLQSQLNALINTRVKQLWKRKKFKSAKKYRLRKIISTILS